VAAAGRQKGAYHTSPDGKGGALRERSIRLAKLVLKKKKKTGRVLHAPYQPEDVRKKVGGRI